MIRARGYEPSGRRFESFRVRHFYRKIQAVMVLSSRLFFLILSMCARKCASKTRSSGVRVHRIHCVFRHLNLHMVFA